jgi:hypothetical protein
MKVAAFWIVGLCRLVEVYRRFIASIIMAIALITEASSTSETSVDFYRTTWRINPEDDHLHIQRCENLKSDSENL